MSSEKPPPTKAEVMPLLANGINNALVGTFGKPIEFLLVIAMPTDDEGYVELSTITGITDPGQLQAISKHIGDLARMNAEKQQGLDPDSDADVKGHA